MENLTEVQKKLIDGIVIEFLVINNKPKPQESGGLINSNEIIELSNIRANNERTAEVINRKFKEELNRRMIEDCDRLNKDLAPLGLFAIVFKIDQLIKIKPINANLAGINIYYSLNGEREKTLDCWIYNKIRVSSSSSCHETKYDTIDEVMPGIKPSIIYLYENTKHLIK